MKSLTSISFSFLILCSLAAQAQSDTPPPVPETQAVVSAPAQPAHLAYGIDDVLKLARAKVGEEVIVAFVQSSGIAYSLRANDIVYLRDQGVTDHVISVMLSQKAAVNTASTAPAHLPRNLFSRLIYLRRITHSLVEIMFSRFLPHTRSHIQRPHTRTTVHIMGMGTRITIPRTIRTMGTDMDIVDIHTALVTDIAVTHIGTATATATVIMVTAIMATEAMVSLRFIRDGTAVAAG